MKNVATLQNEAEVCFEDIDIEEVSCFDIVEEESGSPGAKAITKTTRQLPDGSLEVEVETYYADGSKTISTTIRRPGEEDLPAW
jgi:hypothetical protein